MTVIQDNTPQPKFFGTGATTAISGDAAFLAAFGPVGTIDSFDWIEMPLSCAVAANCTTLDQLATTTTSASAPISSGEKLTAAVPVPSRFVLEFDWRGLRSDEDTWSGSKVNRLIGEFLGQAVPSVHFAHSDLT